MVLSWIFKEKWFWIILVAIASIILVPFIVIAAILSMPPILRVVATAVLILCWGVAAAYRDWVKEKREQEKKTERTGSA
jgi:cell shape-determining protein MreC